MNSELSNKTLKDLRDSMYHLRNTGYETPAVMVYHCLHALVYAKPELRLVFNSDFDNDKRLDQIPLSFFKDVTTQSLLRINNFGRKKLAFLQTAIEALGLEVE